MDVMERIAACGVVPVVVIDDAAKAVPTANAMLAGGVGVMEITFRTAAAADSIRAVAAQCPDMLVGAGTIITLEQAKLAVECGASFIVSPGYDEETVAWCCANSIPITPGCVTPTEIMAAMKHGLKVVKFFPSNIYGGVTAMKALAGPFPGIKFIPTCGINMQNCAEILSCPQVFAVGGSWASPKPDISAGNYAKITELCRQTRKALLGFELKHIGINCPDASAQEEVCARLKDAFGFETRDCGKSAFAGDGIEVMKTLFKGSHGHIAVGTNKMAPAIAELRRRGYKLDEQALTAGDDVKYVYLEDEFGGFAVHLVLK